MKTIILFSLLFFFYPAYPGLDPFSCGSRSRACASSGMIFSDEWSLCNGAAALAFIKTNSLGIFSGNRFLVPALTEAATGYQRMNKILNWGFALKNFGYSSYSESTLQLSFSKKLNEGFALGLSVHGTVISSKGYGKQIAIIPEPGFFLKLNADTDLAGKIFNPALQKLENSLDERIASIAYIALLHRLEKHLDWTAEFQLDLNKGGSFSVGCEYSPLENFALQAAFKSTGNSFSTGIGFKKKKLNTGLACSFHQYLGLSGSANLNFQL